MEGRQVAVLEVLQREGLSGPERIVSVLQHHIDVLYKLFNGIE